VLFLADHPVTGGYPVAVVVLDDDVDRAAQVRPGGRVRFVQVTGSGRARSASADLSTVA
jgi:allophanate hydrolase subunit 2